MEVEELTCPPTAAINELLTLTIILLIISHFPPFFHYKTPHRYFGIAPPTLLLDTRRLMTIVDVGFSLLDCLVIVILAFI